MSDADEPLRDWLRTFVPAEHQQPASVVDICDDIV
jgi:hypothetical protein